MHYRDIARREHTLKHEFGYILKALLAKGETFSSLARKTGIGLNTIAEWAKPLGLKSLGCMAPYVRVLNSHNRRKSRRFHYDHEKTTKLYNDGLTIAEIAKSFGISANWLETRRREAAVSSGELTVRCDFCVVEFEKGSIHQRFCSSVCNSRYRSYLSKVARSGLDTVPFGGISECCNPECGETWKIVDQPSSLKRYCSLRCKNRSRYLRRTNQAVAA